MIFVILGTQKFQMNRLLIQVDSLVSSGEIRGPVLAQIGHSDYEPKSFPFRRFLDKAEFDRLVSEAGVIVTHGGVSTIVSALKCRKRIVVCPRLARYGEHVDDHQREIARAFARKGYLLCCEEGDDLAEMIASCEGKGFQEYVSQTNEITRIINGFLKE